MALPNQVCVAVSIPGPRGITGAPGAKGMDGISASTELTAPFTMPAQLGTVIVDVLDSSVFSFGEIVYVAVAGYMQVVGIPNAFQLALLNLRNDSTGGGGGGAGGGGTIQIYTDPKPVTPIDPTLPALYYPSGGGTLEEWDVASQAWL